MLVHAMAMRAPQTIAARKQEQRAVISGRRTKQVNASHIMHDIWVHRDTTRVDVARRLGLDKSTVTTIVNELLAYGVLIETQEGYAGPLGGRRPVHIALNAEYGCVLGIELRPRRYIASVVDLHGNEVFTLDGEMEITAGTLTDCAARICERVLAEHPAQQPPLLSVGIGAPGIVDPEAGIIKLSLPLNIDTPTTFAPAISDRIGLRCFIENDANAAAWGELAFHRQRDLSDLLFVLVEIQEWMERGVLHRTPVTGLGVVIGGAVHHGRDHFAGEFRSVRARTSTGRQVSLSPRELDEAVDDTRLMRRYLGEIAEHVALLANTMDLTHIFLGGGLEWNEDDVRSLFSRAIQANWPYNGRVPCTVAFSTLGERAVAYGAAGMVLERAFSDREMLKEVIIRRPETEGAGLSSGAT